MARVVIAGLGPAGPDLVTASTSAAIARIGRQHLRTLRHPAAGLAPNASSFDDLYDSAPDLDSVYSGIVEALVASAREHGEVLYLVPGSPAVAERSVELLRSDSRVEVEVLPALSFLDLAWPALGVDPVAAGVRIVDGHRFAVEAAGERGPLLIGQCDTRHVLSEIKLAVDDGPEQPVTVVQRLGLPDQHVFQVAWNDLDRAFEPDHLTSIYVPALAAPVGAELVRFAELMRTLRERCPWDAAQTHASLTRHLLEETYEVLDAIDGFERTGNPTHLEEELGDLLFQVYFHATLAAEEGHFTLADVARGIHDKLVARHPHVFAGADIPDPADAHSAWEAMKRAEKKRTSIFDGIPPDLPALALAHKVLSKAAASGADIPVAGIGPALSVLDSPTAAGPEAAEAFGSVLLAVVAAARTAGVDAEHALRSATLRLMA